MIPITTIMRMRTAREIRRIDRDDRAFTLKDN